MIASYTRGRTKCRTPAVTKARPRRRGTRSAYEQARVAIGTRTGEVLRAAALRIEVGELAADAGETLAVVVDHPRLERDAVARLPQAEHAGLLREVGEGRRAEEPVAAVGGDPVLVRVAVDRRDHVRVPVEHRQRLRRQLVVAEDHNPPFGSELLVEPRQLGRLDPPL